MTTSVVALMMEAWAIDFPGITKKPIYYGKR